MINLASLKDKQLVSLTTFAEVDQSSGPVFSVAYDRSGMSVAKRLQNQTVNVLELFDEHEDISFLTTIVLAHLSFVIVVGAMH